MTVASGSNNIVARLNENGMLLTEGMTLKFEGATNDSFETILTVTDPTADRTITLPNSTGTVALTSDVPSDTDGLSEGSTNLYYTNARVQSYLSGGTGVTLSGSGEFSYRTSCSYNLRCNI